MLKWSGIALAIGLIVHAVIYGQHHSPPGYLSIHIAATMFAGLAYLIERARHSRDEREEAIAQDAYDEGRAQSFTAVIDEFERRTQDI